jgi:hypothetical protein
VNTIAVELHLRADDAAVAAEATLPHIVAQHDHGRAIVADLVWRETRGQESDAFRADRTGWATRS